MNANPSDIFVGHEPCPRCLSRDNLGRWQDGHAFCFGCGYREPPTRSLKNNYREVIKEDVDNLWGGDPPVLPIPHDPLRWLKKYGITDEEIKKYGICWQPKRERLVLPFKENGKIICFQGRYFGRDPMASRYITFGKRRHFNVFDERGDSSPLVFVEDYISAIKIGRSYAGYPILGSIVSDSALESARRRWKQVVVWLDSDKVQNAYKAVLRARFMGLDAHRVYTEKDPKEYSDREILSLINESVTR